MIPCLSSIYFHSVCVVCSNYASVFKLLRMMPRETRVQRSVQSLLISCNHHWKMPEPHATLSSIFEYGKREWFVKFPNWRVKSKSRVCFHNNALFRLRWVVASKESNREKKYSMIVKKTPGLRFYSWMIYHGLKWTSAQRNEEVILDSKKTFFWKSSKISAAK